MYTKYTERKRIHVVDGNIKCLYMGYQSPCQSPYNYPTGTREGVVGHYIDRCITLDLLFSLSWSTAVLNDGISFASRNVGRKAVIFVNPQGYLRPNSLGWTFSLIQWRSRHLIPIVHLKKYGAKKRQKRTTCHALLLKSLKRSQKSLSAWYPKPCVIMLCVWSVLNQDVCTRVSDLHIQSMLSSSATRKNSCILVMVLSFPKKALLLHCVVQNLLVAVS